MIDLNACREKFSIATLFKWIKYKFSWRKQHPDYFDPDGLCIFVGPQGSGKTLSAVNYIYNLMQAYPDCKLVTNVALADYPVVTFDAWCAEYAAKPGEDLFELYVYSNRIFPFVDNDDFCRYSNASAGVIFFVDEIQLYLSSLESRNINIDVLTQISQQRKQRKHIVATSQIFGRMAKPLREQFSSVMVCKNLLGCVQFNRLLSRDDLESDDSSGTNLRGRVKKKFLWTHDPRMYKRYDTSSIIEKGKFVSGEDQLKLIGSESNAT